MPRTQTQTLTIHTETQRRIGSVAAIALVVAAVAVDSLQFGLYLFGLFPLIGPVIALLIPPIIAFMAWIAFFLWFKLLGVDFMDGLIRKAVIMCTGALAELVPLINALPIWTISVIALIIVVRIEDAAHTASLSRLHTQLVESVQKRGTRQTVNESGAAGTPFAEAA